MYALLVSIITFYYLYLTIRMAATRADQRRDMVNADREEEAVKNDSIMSYEMDRASTYRCLSPAYPSWSDPRELTCMINRVPIPAGTRGPSSSSFYPLLIVALLRTQSTSTAKAFRPACRAKCMNCCH